MTEPSATPTYLRRARWIALLSKLQAWTTSAETQGFVSSDVAERLRLALGWAVMETSDPELESAAECEAAARILQRMFPWPPPPPYDPSYG